MLLPKEWVMCKKGGGQRKKKMTEGENIPHPQLEFHLSTIYIYSDSSDAKYSAP
jgi:hypothetical protein